MLKYFVVIFDAELNYMFQFSDKSHDHRYASRCLDLCKISFLDRKPPFLDRSDFVYPKALHLNTHLHMPIFLVFTLYYVSNENLPV